jgi:hypothetical protein
MKRMKFNNEDLFIKYCILNTIKTKAPASQKKQILKEIRMIKELKTK